MNEDVRKDIERTNAMLNEETDMVNAWFDYDRDQRAMRNGEITDAVNTALEEAKEKFEKEKEEAISRNNIKLAQKMLTKGISKEEVSDITNIPIEEL